MDFITLWDQAVQNIVKTFDDDKEKKLLLLIGSQVSIFIQDSILTFQCKSQYVSTLIPEYLSFFFREVKRLSGMQNLGVSIQTAETPISPLQPSYVQQQVPQQNIGQQLQPSYMQQNMYQNMQEPLAQNYPVAQNSQNTLIQAQNVNQQKSSYVFEDRIMRDKTFDNYVTDPENELIFAIARKIAADPGSNKTNPFYIYGGSGLGKSHLLFAIANEIRKTHPEKTVAYMRGEDFINLFVKALIPNNKPQNYNFEQINFKSVFTSQDVLIIDDIQNFVKAKAARATFFEIIADILDKPNHQLILASDVPPGNLEGFNERETSRFSSGVCREIFPPNTETRAAITISKSREFHVELPDNIIDYIATHIRSNVREIEGAIKTLRAVKSTMNGLTYDEAVKSLQSLVNTSSQTTTIDNVKERVAKELYVSVEQMESRSRKKPISRARSIAITLASELIPSLSLNDIGKSFKKDHSSVHTAIKRTRKWINEDQEIKNLYQKLVLSLKRD